MIVSVIQTEQEIWLSVRKRRKDPGKAKPTIVIKFQGNRMV